MSAPGGGFGESSHDDGANLFPAGGQASEPPDWKAPWDLPESPPAAEYPPPTYPPLSYPSGYSPAYPPPIPPPPGYGPLPGYGGPPYQPGPPPFGGPPACYGPPSYPGYYPTPHYQGAMQPGTNGLAIASLVSSFTGFLCCFVGSIAAIVLGVVALNQIKQTRQDGYGMAVAGIVIGIGTLLVFLIVAIFSVHSH